MKSAKLEEVLIAIQNIALHLQNGDSVQLAKKKACGGLGNKLCKSVNTHHLYLKILDRYLVEKKINFRFKLEGEKLVMTKQSKPEIISHEGKRDRESNPELPH